MKLFVGILCCLYLTLQTSLCFSKDSINFIAIPDLLNCHHHLGFEVASLENSTFGVLGSAKCNSDRATYGDSNSEVKTTFSRIFIPWRYSFDDVFKDGYLMQTMLGIEKSEFRSEAGSSAEVTFIDLTFHGGYQWFWGNGFNVSALAGIAILKKSNLDKNISENESGDVTEFLDKNTKSNVHIGIGVVFGWLF